MTTLAGARTADLVVAGGGPAGLAAAIHGARAGMNVVVIEPRSGVIDKACGEGIMPVGVASLAALGIRPHGARFVGVRHGDTSEPDLHATGTFRTGSGLGVRRTVLHEAMMDVATSAGVRWAHGRVTDVACLDDHVCVGGLRTRWLIGADGLRSVIRSILGVGRPPRHPPRLGVRRHYAMSPWSDRVEVTFADGAEAYVTPVDVDLVGVAILFTSDSQVATPGTSPFDALLQRFPQLAARLPQRHASTARGAGPFEQRVSRRVVGNVLLVGDAAGYLDPLTGEGVALGLLTAEAAVAAILAGAPAGYEATYRRITRRYDALTALLLATARERRLHRPFLRLARMLPGAFDRALDMLGPAGV